MNLSRVKERNTETNSGTTKQQNGYNWQDKKKQKRKKTLNIEIVFLVLYATN